MLTIRAESPEDIDAIHSLNEKAFSQPDEADLVDNLRRANALIISLVAVQMSKIVGHIAFSPVTIESDKSSITAIGLAPMAVAPDMQNMGIGSRLVEAGLAECIKHGYTIAVVLGHPNYYPRFGFTPSKPFGIEWEHPAPEEAFMVMELKKGVLASLALTKGIVRFRPEFDMV